MITVEKLEKGTYFDDAFKISFRYDPTTVAKVKELAERRYLPEDRAWEIPAHELPALIEKVQSIWRLRLMEVRTLSRERLLLNRRLMRCVITLRKLSQRWSNTYRGGESISPLSLTGGNYGKTDKSKRG